MGTYAESHSSTHRGAVVHDGADVIGHVHVVQVAPRLNLEVELFPQPYPFLVHPDEVLAVRARVLVPEPDGVAQLVQQGAELTRQHSTNLTSQPRQGEEKPHSLQ